VEHFRRAAMTVSEQETTTFATNDGAILPILLSVGIIMRQDEGGKPRDNRNNKNNNNNNNKDDDNNNASITSAV